MGSGPTWHTNYTTTPPFTVSDIGSFSAFEIKVQAVNEEGKGPEPDPVIGYSGEDRKIILKKSFPANFLYWKNLSFILTLLFVFQFHWRLQ